MSVLVSMIAMSILTVRTLWVHIAVPVTLDIMALEEAAVSIIQVVILMY